MEVNDGIQEESNTEIHAFTQNVQFPGKTSINIVAPGYSSVLLVLH